MKNEKTVYALGFFDGVHLGHQALLSACREMANGLGCKAGVVTFTSHPAALVSGSAPGLINTAADRKTLLLSFEMDRVVELPFDREMMQMPWQEFFRLLLEKLGAAGLVCGADFRFGDRGLGNSDLLAQACREAGVPCTVVPEQKLEDITISSTYIRSLLETGQTEKAARFLGHPHILSGEVVPGCQLGRTLGIPTANLELPQGLVQPKFGVYACLVRVAGNTYRAVTNVGKQPTVGGNRVKVESWLLDFDGDLYGKTITVEFHAFLRPEKKFSDLSELKAKIQEDAGKTRDFFGKK